MMIEKGTDRGIEETVTTMISIATIEGGTLTEIQVVMKETGTAGMTVAALVPGSVGPLHLPDLTLQMPLHSQLKRMKS